MAAQWDDDIHHAIHTAVSGERQGYYRDFGTMHTLAQTLGNGFFHAGTYSSFRGRRHGRPVDTSTIPATRLVAYTTDHDQIGNRAIGDRPSQNLTSGQLAVKAALVLASPYTAMLFMGEEWGASTPFQFFTSTPSLSWPGRPPRAARPNSLLTVGTPTRYLIPRTPETFIRSKLNWAEITTDEHQQLRRLYQALISLRRVEADFADPWLGHMGFEYNEDQRWIILRRGAFVIACNLSENPVALPAHGRTVLAWAARLPTRPEPRCLGTHSRSSTSRSRARFSSSRSRVLRSHCL